MGLLSHCNAGVRSPSWLGNPGNEEFVTVTHPAVILAPSVFLGDNLSLVNWGDVRIRVEYNHREGRGQRVETTYGVVIAFPGTTWPRAVGNWLYDMIGGSTILPVEVLPKA
jgi:hypothetical protein